MSEPRSVELLNRIVRALAGMEKSEEFDRMIDAIAFTEEELRALWQQEDSNIRKVVLWGFIRIYALPEDIAIDALQHSYLRHIVLVGLRLRESMSATEEALVKSLLQDKNAVVNDRLDAMFALIACGKNCMNALVGVYVDKSEESYIRMEVAVGLLMYGSRAPLEVIINGLEDLDHHAQKMVTFSLSQKSIRERSVRIVKELINNSSADQLPKLKQLYNDLTAWHPEREKSN